MDTTPAWLDEPAIRDLFAAVRDAGGELRAVGGAVRDFLLGLPGGDVDMATTLTPERVMEMAQQHGWKAVPTGLAHGTVTLVLPGRTVEVTTLRRDVATDGRHAEVAFTDRFEEDAARRDFTMNALYMDVRGDITDFFGGRADVAARRVRFIGDAATRIAEDGLRILRYFRFLATHGTPPAGEDALAAIADKRAMLASLSGERIAMEMKKLLRAEDPSYALGAMAGVGLPPLLTQAPWAVATLPALVAREQEYRLEPHPWLRLMALIAPEARAATAQWVGARWKLSRAERTQLDMLGGAALALDAAAVKAALRDQPRALVVARLLLAALDAGAAIAPLLQLAQEWEMPPFPVTATDLLACGFTQGAALGAALKQLDAAWAASDYRLTKAELLAQLPPQ